MLPSTIPCTAMWISRQNTSSWSESSWRERRGVAAPSERSRVVFVLRRLEGLKYRDIAAQLNISVSAVEKHMERAIAHLMGSLDQP